MTYVTIVDVIILLFLIWGGYKGYRKGFLTEFFSFLLFIIGTLLFFKLLHTGFDMGQSYTGRFPKAFPFFMFMLVFGGVTLGLSIFGRKRMEAEGGFQVFDSFDNVIGMIMGVFKYAVGLSILLWFFTTVGIITPADGLNNTIFYPILMKVFNKVLGVGGVLLPFMSDMVEGIRNLLR